MKKKIGVLLIILSIVLVGVGGYLYFSSPKRIMLKAIANQIKSLNSNLFYSEQIKAKYVTNTKVKSNDMVLASINGDMYEDSINSKYYMNYVIKYFDEFQETTISPEVYLEDKKLYFKVKEYFTDVFYIDFLENTDDSMISEEEINEFFTLLKETLIEELKESSFSKSNKKVQILGKNIDSEKYSLSLTNSDLYDMFEAFITRIEKNKKLPVIRKALFTGTTKEEYLSEFKTTLEDYDKNAKLFEYNIYLKNEEIIKSEIVLLSNNESINIGLGSYEKSGGVYDFEFYIKLNDNNIISATIIGDNNTHKINADFAGMMILEGTIINTEKNNSLNLNLYYSNDKSAPLFTINYEYMELNKNAEYQANLNVDIFNTENKVSFISSTNITFDKEVPKFDISQAKKFDMQSLTGSAGSYGYDLSL